MFQLSINIFRRINFTVVVFFPLGNAPASEFFICRRFGTLRLFRLHGRCKERKQYTEHGERMKSRILQFFYQLQQMFGGTLWASRIANRETYSQACSLIANKIGCLCCGLQCGITVEVCVVVEITLVVLVSTWRRAQQQAWEG
jgi:hypothetical protein